MVYRLFYLLYKKIKHGLGTNPIPNSLKRKFARLFMKISVLGAKKYPCPVKTVLDYDWDYLIVIDACRHDLFEEVYGETDYIISQGSCTTEWFNRTFEDKNYEDLIFVSGNPVVSEYKQERLEKNKVSFFKLEPVWDYGWDEELETVPPEEVTEKALELAEEYPEKRMAVLYQQPHFGFVGDKKITKPILRKLDWGRDTVGKKGVDAWDALGLGKLKEEEVWEAYKDNLKLVMREANKLKEGLNGKVVLTSDHGNCKGEYGIYGHPRGGRIEELVKVPWVILKGE